MLSTLAPEWDLHFHISTKHNKQSKGASRVQAQVSISGHRARQVALIGEQRCLLDKGSVCVWCVFISSSTTVLLLSLIWCFILFLWKLLSFFTLFFWAACYVFLSLPLYFSWTFCVCFLFLLQATLVNHFELRFVYESSDLNEVIILSVCLMMIVESWK